MDPELKDSTKSIPMGEANERASLERMGEILREASQHLEPKTVETPPPLIINQETLKDLDALAERFNLEVKARNVHGKLPPGTIFNGGMPKGSSFNGSFEDHGPDKSIGVYDNKSKDVGTKIATACYYAWRSISGFNLISLRESNLNPGNFIFTMHFLQDKKQIGNRGNPTYAQVSLEFTNKVTVKLIKALVQKPDFLEHLYQKCFKGLDSTEKTPGMRRVKTTGFYFVPDNKREITDEINDWNHYKLVDFLKTLTRYNFVNGPYGSGDVLE